MKRVIIILCDLLLLFLLSNPLCAQLQVQELDQEIHQYEPVLLEFQIELPGAEYSIDVELTSSSLRIVVVIPTPPKYIYRSMLKVNGAYQSSPLTGATNRKQKGCRTPSSNPQFPDITPNAQGNVGPGITGTNGLSVFNKRIAPKEVGETVARFDANKLPVGLALSTPDPTTGHQHIYPTIVMSFADFQTKLNSIAWVDAP